jgi:ABC-2 type transport system permease protein
MPILERSYGRWEGRRVPPERLWRVVTRHALQDAFRSRLVLLVFCASFLLPLGAATFVYLTHNVSALASMRLDPAELLQIDGWFFAGFMAWQCYWFGGLLALLAGPSLVSADLANGAFPLFLARPLTRARYVAGKLAALALLLSAVTWVPGLLVYGLQASLAGSEWARAHVRIPFAIVAGSAAWIAALSLLTLAASALTRRKATAQTLLVALLLGGQVVGAAFQDTLGTNWGFLVSVPEVMRSLVQVLYGVDIEAVLSGERVTFALVVLYGLSLLVLFRRLRAVEIVR